MIIPFAQAVKFGAGFVIGSSLVGAVVGGIIFGGAALWAHAGKRNNQEDTPKQ